LKTLVEGEPNFESLNKITSIAVSPNGMKVAISTNDNVISIFDENGEKKDKFNAKPSEARSFNISSLCFSSDSTKLSVAQTDGGLFVYKLGTSFGEKKAICNKMIISSPIRCQVFLSNLFFGSDDGKIRLGHLKSNKASIVYEASPILSIAANSDGSTIISGHLDGSIFSYNINSGNVSQLCSLSYPIYILNWGLDIVAGGERIITFLNSKGKEFCLFDYSKRDDQEVFTSGFFNPGGNCFIVGSFDKLHTFSFENKKWIETFCGYKFAEK
jgi:intraflagellar transport protein 172